MYSYDSPSLAPHIPSSWKQLLRQIEHLAQFGGAVQVVTGAEGSGKTTLLNELARSLGTNGLVLWPVIDEAWPGHALQVLLNALGKETTSGQSMGESIVALRHFSQNLQRQKQRMVVAVDNSDLLSDASLAGVASVLQGGAEEGFGLHLIFFAEKSLAQRLDQLQLIDVSVYDFDLPRFTLQEVGELLDVHYDDIVQREAIHPLSKDDLQDIWLESQGLPGVAVTLAKEKWALSMLNKSRFSLAGLPVIHIVALLSLLGVLFWALWGREKPTDLPGDTVTSLAVGAPPPAAGALPIEMKKIEPANVPGEATAMANPNEAAATAVAPAANVPAPEPAADLPVIAPTTPALVPASEQLAKPAPTVTAAPAPTPPPTPVAAPPAPTPVAAAKPKTDTTKVEAVAKVETPVKNDAAVKPVAVAKAEAVAKPEAVAKSAKPSVPEAELPPAEELQAIGKSDAPKTVGDAPTINAGVKKLAKLPDSAYVLQLQISSSAKKIEEALAAAPNKKDLAAYRTLRDGKEVFILVEGNYADANAAAAAIKHLPAEQKAAQPWPKKVGLIHAELKTAGVRH